MKFVFPKPKKSTLFLAALWGALLFVGVCYGLSYFPHLGSIPTPTGGRLDLGMLGAMPVYIAALSGAFVGVFTVVAPTPVAK